ncbi:unnamed protein product, partial [Sphagnum jensenii]
MMASEERMRLSPEETNFKRRMKTPVQLEALERVYAEDRYPVESVRAELSAQLNLSDKQLQMWFCHRRLKDRKGKDEASSTPSVSRKKAKVDNSTVLQYPQAVLASDTGDAVLLSGDHYGQQYLYEGLQHFTPEVSLMAGKQRSQELAVRVAVEAQLGEPLREDGPPLGTEFDPLPVGAFSIKGKPSADFQFVFCPHFIYSLYESSDVSLALGLPPPLPNPRGSKRKSMAPPAPLPVQFEPRPLCEYQFLPEQPVRLEESQFYERATKQLNLFPGPERSYEILAASRVRSFVPSFLPIDTFILMEEARLQKEVEAQEKRIQKELEKQEALRRKRDEQMRKEQEKMEREIRKEEERVMRERMKEQERIERENKKEAERQEKLQQKELKRMEKLRHKEEARKEKEAARIKAANERALAKRLAKDVTDLIDDEQLELMEAATAAAALNHDYLDGDGTLDASQILLRPFPPATVKMKPLLSVYPWTDSDQNVGNLLMVWRFLTTFADVVGLWPFTIDELVQGFHDYDSRLLADIHVALVKTMVKDIVDAAQAVAGGTVGQRDAIAMAAGGHPQLVESAYAWGFDIREWGKHVNGLTWPEILRQFALAAGFGPKWKKQNMSSNVSKDEQEKDKREDTVANLRSGAAAANAVALMQGKGIGTSRRSQFCLTPGTVKFAAFHVLSLEGDKGLSIGEVVKRIKTLGLRDLSSSKTPEASVSAVLSRDSNLFERIAPSTYTVRPAFRKDPEDADAILSAARERIRQYQIGLLDGKGVEKEGDDADTEYGSEGQDVEDMEDMEKEEDEEDEEPGSSKRVKANGRGQRLLTQDGTSGDSESPVADGNGAVEIEAFEDIVKEDEEEDGGKEGLQGAKPCEQPEDETELDESQEVELWVQGLVEGEYADLSVEERLNALVALVTTVNQGNAIRVALEERLEAATALKRQMWAEMQLEKRRLKEEQNSRAHVVPAGPRLEGESPEMLAENPGAGASTVDPKSVGTIDVNLSNHHVRTQGDSIAVNGRPCNGMTSLQSSHEAGSSMAHLSEKSRAQTKVDIGLRAEELYVFRSLPLGCDRRHNRYWQFVTGNGGQDPGCGRLFFESNSDGCWSVIDNEEDLDALMTSLDPRGAREAALAAILHRLEGTLRRAMQSKALADAQQLSRLSSTVTCPFPYGERGSGWKGLEGSPVSGISGLESDPVETNAAISVELGRTGSEKRRALERYMDVEKWFWSECFNGETATKATKSGLKRDTDLLVSCNVCHDCYWPQDKHCRCCHATFESSSPRAHSRFLDHNYECEEKKRRGDPNWKLNGSLASMPSRLQLLKAQLLAIELAIPAEALNERWTERQRKLWAGSLKSASGPSELLQVLMTLESVVERDWLASTYETMEEILEVTGSASCAEGQGAVPHWVPLTTAAVAFRISLFDDALAYDEEAKKDREKQEEEDEIKEKSGVGREKGGREVKQAGQVGGRRRSTNNGGAASKSRARASSSGPKNSKPKRKLQFVERETETLVGDGRQVKAGAGRRCSTRTVAGRTGQGGRAPQSGGRSKPAVRSNGRRSQTSTRRPGPKQRNPNELMLPVSQRPSKVKLLADSQLSEQDPEEEEEEEEEESNAGGSQAGGHWEASDEGSEDGDPYDIEENPEIEDDEGQEQNGSDTGEGEEEEEERMYDEQAEGDGDELDGNGEEDGEDQDEENSYDAEEAGDDESGQERRDVSDYGRGEIEDEEDEETGDIETEDEAD